MKKTPRQKRSGERKRALKAAKDALSLYIRERDNYTCFTCGAGPTSGKVMQCGHLITASRSATQFYEKNCHCQCAGCNYRHEHDYEIYRRAFVEKYGEAAYDDMYNMSWATVKRTAEDYREIERYFKNKLAELRMETINE